MFKTPVLFKTPNTNHNKPFKGVKLEVMSHPQRDASLPVFNSNGLPEIFQTVHHFRNVSVPAAISYKINQDNIDINTSFLSRMSQLEKLHFQIQNNYSKKCLAEKTVAFWYKKDFQGPNSFSTYLEGSIKLLNAILETKKKNPEIEIDESTTAYTLKDLVQNKILTEEQANDYFKSFGFESNPNNTHKLK